MRDGGKMLKIGDFSKLSCISVRMLRYYDKHNILKPSSVDDYTGYRFYTAKQLEEASIILKLRSLKFSIAEIKNILSSDSEIDVNSYFNNKKEEIQNELNHLIKVEEEINHFIDSDFNDITYNVIKKEIPIRNVASVRRVIKDYMCEKDLWFELYKELDSMNIRIIDDGYAMAIFHDLEYKESNVDVEVQVSVDRCYVDTADICFYRTDAIDVASVIFTGNYYNMPKVTQSAIRWIEINGYELAQPSFNIYHVSPAQDKSCDNWVTESCFIIREGDNNGKSYK